MRGYKNLIYNLASQGRQGGTAAGDKLKAHFSMHFLWRCILNTDPLVRRKIIAQITLYENMHFVFGRIPGACRSSRQTPFVKICLHNTKSPTTKEASFCQLQGVCSPRPWAAAPAAAGDARLCSLAALQAGPAAPPPQHPRATANQAHHASAKHLSGVAFFRPSPLSSGLLLNLDWEEWKKKALC